MFKKALTISILSGFGLLAACNQAEQPLPPVANSQPVNANTMVAEDMPYDDTDPWVKDNFDLQRAGELLRKSKSPAEFEAYLNEPDGINNLDLNGDGYADYISVEEFEDRGDGQRGLSLFSRFGPDLIQNIASIFLYRDEPRYPGARVLLRGDDVLYGDNYYYETNWLDQTIGIASMLFGDHDRYRSPYYYDHYPPNYVAYDVVETPYYRTRIERLWPEPIFVYTSAAPVYYERVKIKSPNNGRHLGQLYGRPMKPTKDQIAFRRGNPGKPMKAKKDDPGRSENAPGQRGVPPGQAKHIDDGPASDKGHGNPGGPPKADKPGKPDNPGKPNKPNAPGGQNKGGDKPKGNDKGHDQHGGGKGKGKP
ncbi:MAG TPA: hypothetical protein PLK77_08870 [Pyrinomonadaceae bacterium]|nr:hypothetical protein [Pyrinomonadaceae bacterium]